MYGYMFFFQLKVAAFFFFIVSLFQKYCFDRGPLCRSTCQHEWPLSIKSLFLLLVLYYLIISGINIVHLCVYLVCTTFDTLGTPPLADVHEFDGTCISSILMFTIFHVVLVLIITTLYLA